MSLKSLVLELWNKAVTLVQSEPLVITGAIVSAIVWVAGHFGVVLDSPSLTSVLAPLVVSVLGRFHVTPVSRVRMVLAARGCDKSDCPHK